MSRLVFLAAALFAQTADVPRFEVAAIKPSDPDPQSYSSGIATGHGKLNAENVTLKRCIMGAYGVGPHQIFGGPEWLDSDHFNIMAKADREAGDHELMAMLQALLIERFKLAVHRESRVQTALILELAKGGSKMERSPGGEASTNSSGNGPHRSIDARNTTMDRFADVLSRQMDLPVVNRTGLDGQFNLKVQWAREDAAVDGPSIFTAVQEQLGLHLRSDKVPIDVLVIDHAEHPSEN